MFFNNFYCQYVMQTQNLNLIVLQLVHSNVQHAMFFGCFFLNRKMSWLYLFCHTGASTQAHKIKFFMQVKLNVVFFFFIRTFSLICYFASTCSLVLLMSFYLAIIHTEKILQIKQWNHCNCANVSGWFSFIHIIQRVAVVASLHIWPSCAICT